MMRLNVRMSSSREKIAISTEQLIASVVVSQKSQP